MHVAEFIVKGDRPIAARVTASTHTLIDVDPLSGSSWLNGCSCPSVRI
jgi:hypothetical protein